MTCFTIVKGRKPGDSSSVPYSSTIFAVLSDFLLLYLGKSIKYFLLTGTVSTLSFPFPLPLRLHTFPPLHLWHCILINFPHCTRVWCARRRHRTWATVFILVQHLMTGFHLAYLHKLYIVQLLQLRSKSLSVGQE